MTLPKLNLRDLFWLVVVVAMGMGWWTERSNLKANLATASTDIVEVVAAITSKTKDAILNIRVVKEGELVVMTGQVRGPLDGSGSIFLLQKRNGKWHITEAGDWVS
jgi:hypothetical protein